MIFMGKNRMSNFFPFILSSNLSKNVKKETYWNWPKKLTKIYYFLIQLKKKINFYSTIENYGKIFHMVLFLSLGLVLQASQTSGSGGSPLEDSVKRVIFLLPKKINISSINFFSRLWLPVHAPKWLCQLHLMLNYDVKLFDASDTLLNYLDLHSIPCVWWTTWCPLVQLV